MWRSAGRQNTRGRVHAPAGVAISGKIPEPRQLNDVVRRQDRANQISLRHRMNFIQMTLRFWLQHKLPDALVEGAFDDHVGTRAEGGANPLIVDAMPVLKRRVRRKATRRFAGTASWCRRSPWPGHNVDRAGGALRSERRRSNGQPARASTCARSAIAPRSLSVFNLRKASIRRGAMGGKRHLGEDGRLDLFGVLDAGWQFIEKILDVDI
jgi:hypothetical protein